MPLSRKPATVSPRRLIAVVAVSVVALVVALRVQHFRHVTAQAEALTLQHLRTAARVTAERLDADAIARLHARYPRRDDIRASDQDPDYARVHEALRLTHRQFDLSTPVYLLVPADDPGVIELTVTSAREPYWRHRVTSPREARGFAYGTPGELSVYHDEAGGWLSAFAPVRTADGTLVAMVQADECFDVFRANAAAAAAEGLWWNALLLALVLASLGYYLHDVIRRERASRRDLEAAVERQRQLTGELSAKQAELAAKSRALERSNRDLKDFANVASHDLKSPIRGISNFAQLLARRNRATLDARSNEYLDFITSSARRATALVDGLLRYATSDGAAAETERVSLNAVAAQATQALQAVIDERGAVVEVGALPEAECDPVLVSQLFQNLIGNGLKYNRAETPRVWVDAVEGDGGQTVFRVRDNGIGIPPEHQAQVFEMFRRLHGGDEFEGSGIGLAFCTRLVARYGGTVWLESEEGVGSTFSFTLPQAVGRLVAVPGASTGATVVA